MKCHNQCTKVVFANTPNPSGQNWEVAIYKQFFARKQIKYPKAMVVNVQGMGLGVDIQTSVSKN